MPFDLKSILAEYEGVPTVDIYGILSYASHPAPSQPERDGPWDYSFAFDGWRIGDQEIQVQRLPVRFLGSREALVELRRQLNENRIIHIQARVIWNPNGQPFGLFGEWVEPIQDDATLNELQRQFNSPAYFNSPALPALLATEYYWEGSINIPFWAWSSTSADEMDDWATFSDGSVALSMEKAEAPSTFSGSLYPPPSPAQIAAVHYLLENQATVSNIVFQAIYDIYPEWQSYYGSDPEYMPDISSLEELRAMIDLKSINIPLVEKDGIGYVLFHFGCYWDPEHGFNAATHKSRLFFLDYSDPTYAAKDDAQSAAS